MKVVTASEMQRIDTMTIQEFGIPGMVLMERAGISVAVRTKEWFGRKRIIVICGKGNNGGDGFVAARELHNEGWYVTVFLISDPQTLSEDAMLQYLAAERFGVPMRSVGDLLSSPQSFLGRHTLIIDAILGTGLSKPVKGTVAEVISVMNKSGLPILSVDIPSGISADNGQVMGIAVKAACTVTFGLPKRGHFLHPGATHAGKLSIEDIGFPRTLTLSPDIPVEYVERRYASSLIPARALYSHKGHYGHVLLIAGSRGKTGAARMAAKACLRSGAGLLTVGVPASLADVFQSFFAEEMTLVLPDAGNGTLSAKSARAILDFMHESADVMAIGPGIGVSRDTVRILREIVRQASCPVIIDADGIHALQGDKKLLRQAQSPVVLTPHPGEMQSLLKDSSTGISDIERDRISAAMSFAKETGTHVVLKGVPTVIAVPDRRVFINSTGNPGMATAGAGDVLTGMIAGLIGQRGEPNRACILGVYLHGLAGDIAASRSGQHALLATDIIDCIPNAFGSLLPQD